MRTSDHGGSPVIIDRRYELHATLGRGGMGVVYRAQDLLTGKPVALKQVILPASLLVPASGGTDLDLSLALAQEFRALATIRHPHIISVYDFGFDQQRQPYFTMEYIDGGRSILDAGRDLPLKEKVNLLVQVLQALVYLHRRNVLHRDLKPANALVLNGRVRLMDFGLSVITSQTMEHLTQTASGTMAYMAPELFHGAPYSRASDLYAVGLMALELLTGRYPYDDSNMATMLNDILNKPVDASAFGVPNDLANVLNKLLAKGREERYADAAEVIVDLCAAASLPHPPETEEIRESFLQAAKFVGREAELSQLAELLVETTRGRGAALLVGGESGVGKSRLLDELRMRALVKGVLVLRGQAIREGRSPYQLWRDVLRTLTLYVEMSDEEAAIVKVAMPDLDQGLGRVLPDAPELSPQEAQGRFSRTIRELIQRLGQPVLVILEDIHWAGSESLQLMIDTANSAADRPLLLAGTFRDDEPLPLGDELKNLTRLTLRRLTNEEIAELSASMLGQAGQDPEVVALLQRETEGNAFFLVETVRLLAEEAGSLDRIGAEALPESTMTGGVQAILDRRLERVPEDARPLLQLASVAGRVLDLALLRLLEPGVNLDSWLATCTDLAVLEADGETWRFSHDKLREAIRETLSHDLHHELHHRVALGMESLYPDTREYAAALAHHWAVAGNRERELHYSELAGHQAARNSANEEAVIFFKRSLELLMSEPNSPERDRRELALQIALGPPLMALRGYTAPDVGRTYARAQVLASRTGQIDLQFQATWGQWTYHNHRFDRAAEEALLKQLFQLANRSGDKGLLLEAHHSGWSTELSRGDAAAVESHVASGLELYDRQRHHDHIRLYGHDPGVCAHFVGGIGLWLLGYPDQARDRAFRGLALAEEIRHPYSSTIIKWGTVVVFYLRGDRQLATEKSQELIAFSQEHGFSMLNKVAMSLETISRANRVRGPEARGQIYDALDRGLSTGGFILWPWILSLALEACLSVGAVDDGLQAIRNEFANHPLTGLRVFESEVRRLYGELMLAKDSTQAAESENQFRLAIDIARRQSARSLELRAVMSLARLWQQQSKRQEARQLLADCYGQFTEGFDTADLSEARSLLDDLR